MRVQVSPVGSGTRHFWVHLDSHFIYFEAKKKKFFSLYSFFGLWNIWAVSLDIFEWNNAIPKKY